MPATTATWLKSKCQSEMMNKVILSRGLHLTSSDLKERRDLRTFRMSMPAKNLGASVFGDNTVNIDGLGEQ